MPTATSVPANYSGTAKLACTLASVSGFVDGVGATYIAGVFVSFMSGNTTSAGIAVGTAQWGKALHSVIPIPLYVFGVLLGSLILLRSARMRPWVYVLTALLLTGFMLFSQHWEMKTGWPEVFGAALLAVPMGTMNATLRKVGGFSVGLGYVTGTLASLGENLAKWTVGPRTPAQSEGVWLYAGLWLCFFVGAALGSYGVHRLSSWALLVPVVTLLVVTFNPAVRSPAQPADL